MKNLFTAFILLLFFSYTQAAIQSAGSASIDSLLYRVTDVLKKTSTPGVGFAIIQGDSITWSGSLGLKNTEHNIAGDKNTMYRIGSVSKMFAAIAILQLVEDGKLNLNDPVRDLIPEIYFKNDFSDTDPVRVVHLLEHTTGWDDIHRVQVYANNKKRMSLLEGLNFHPHSRYSRWLPGSRMSYCNSGTNVAAYIIQKVSGIPFEAYVQKKILQPLRMNFTSYHNDSLYKANGATLYDNHAAPIDYQYINPRPAGAISSSPADMARFLQFLVTRGEFDSVSLIAEGSFDRMESTLTTSGAQAGLEIGYGLFNDTFLRNGFKFRGHGGGVSGAITNLLYSSDQGTGYFLSINSENRESFHKIDEILADYLTGSLAFDSSALPALYSGPVDLKPGYYVSIDPRHQWGAFFDNFLDVYKFENTKGTISKRWILNGHKKEYLPVAPNKFRSTKSPFVNMVVAQDPLVGEVLHSSGQVLMPVSELRVYGQYILFITWVFLMFTGGLIFLFLMVRKILRKQATSLRVCVLPVITSALFVMSVVLFFVEWYNPELAAGITYLSVITLIVSSGFALGPLWSFYVLFKTLKVGINRFVWIHMLILSVLHLTVVIYLLSYNAIPIMSWS